MFSHFIPIPKQSDSACFLSLCVHYNLSAGNTKGEGITVPLTSCLTGLESAVWQLTIFGFCLQNRLIQTSQTGGQQYSDTSPFSIPCFLIWMLFMSLAQNFKLWTKWATIMLRFRLVTDIFALVKYSLLLIRQICSLTLNACATHPLLKEL